MDELIVKSPAFENNKNIPKKYTCDSEDVNPPLTIESIPEGTESLVLIVDDPDAPMGTWDHWIVWDIPPAGEIAENSVPGTEGMNSFNRTSYGGPCPPSGTHRYFFKVYALDKKLDLDSSARKKDVIDAMKNHIVAKGQLIGLYSR
jgi:Raf kinase inhibitor-like YbhB/YbcL family protein